MKRRVPPQVRKKCESKTQPRVSKAIERSNNNQFVVKVNEDGRMHYAVPLKGPRYKEHKPYLIAHYSMPRHAEREVLIDKLAEIVAEAVVKERFEEAEALHRSELSPPSVGASSDENTSINTHETKPRRTKGGRSKRISVRIPSPKMKGRNRPR